MKNGKSKLLTRAETLNRIAKVQGEKTDVEFARELGVSPATLSSIKRGIQRPNGEVLEFIGLRMTELYEEVKK